MHAVRAIAGLLVCRDKHMMFYTLRVRQDSPALSLYQRGFGLTFLHAQAERQFFISANHALMLVVIPASTGAVAQCRGHVMYPLASDVEVDQLFKRVTNAGARALMAPRRTALGHYSAYVNDDDGYLWELTCNVHLLDQDGVAQERQ